MPFGPEVSWPGGYQNLEYQGGDYRYSEQPALPAAQDHGEHPYASYSAAGYGDNGTGYAAPSPDSFGYGDPGYSNPGYDGPSSQDAGIAGTRTVRGFVESRQQDPGYQGGSGYQPYAALPAASSDYGTPGYGQPANYAQPWDYEQPLRYDGEDPTYLGTPSNELPSADYRTDGYGSTGYDTPGYDAPGYDNSGYGESGYGTSGRDSAGYQSSAYSPAAYNGSDLSRPGIDGPGYDLSEIIGTSDFPSFGYDEPSVQRLSYDDPRYDDGSRGSRQDRPRFDETRLDTYWPGEGHPSGGFPTLRDPGEGGGAGRGRSDHGNPGGGRSLSRAGADYGERHPSNETRLDLGYRADETRFDVPAYGSRYEETRLDMRALSSAPGRAATGLLAPERPMTWTDETSLDSFAGLDFSDELPMLREEPSRAVATALREAPPVREDTGSQRAVGRRRGRSSDRRQWLALGAVAVVAVGAITGVLSKFVFSGPSGPAHTISTPTSLDSFTRSASYEKAMDVSALKAEVIQGSSGQASDVVSAVYAEGSTTPGSANQQVFMFVGGHLANGDPASSIKSFEQSYPHSTIVSAGSLGGEAACTTTTAGSNNEAVSMCVFFDNDSFGTFVSPSMQPTQLAQTMANVRPGIEQVTK